MHARVFQGLLVALILSGLLGASRMQDRLNLDREVLGLTRATPLENAPPVLAFTTVALGGFRGLIANALWIRMDELQQDGKYFEMVQLADWISKLQPTAPQAWVHLAWNMSYNVSVQIPDLPARWPWVRRGIELLRDEGLRYNPHDILIYRELAWHFQHKMGQDLDDAHWVYKRQWAYEMSFLLGDGRPDWDALIHPKTEEQKARSRILSEEYKLDPVFMRKVDERYGPLEWRLPETHAIYWAMLGLENAKTREQLIQLRRVIYQSLHLACIRGRLLSIATSDKEMKRFEMSPNVELVDKANQAYLDQIRDDVDMRQNIETGHKNFLRDVSWALYTHNRITEAQKWFSQLKQTYTNAVPEEMTLDEYALARVTEYAGETSRNKTILMVEGLVQRSYYYQAIGEDDQAEGYQRLAMKIWDTYTKGTEFRTMRGNEKVRVDRVDLDPMPVIRKRVLDEMLNPDSGYLDEILAAQLRTALGLPPPPPRPVTATNAPPATLGTGVSIRPPSVSTNSAPSPRAQ
ncbi:MAG: hypothetical protein AB7O66_08345 [Limisphaerales bacterium]